MSMTDNLQRTLENPDDPEYRSLMAVIKSGHTKDTEHEAKELLAAYNIFLGQNNNLADWVEYIEKYPPSPACIAFMLYFAEKAFLSKKGKKGANAVHNKPGGSREKQESIRAIWASGKYSSRERCAEEEYDALGMSFSTARKALRGTPDPA